MFSARIFILLISLGRIIYDLVLAKLADDQRKKPLPEEVSDIYDADRYQTYLAYEADKKKLKNKYKIINLIFDIIVIFSPIYAWVDNVSNHNPYISILIIYAIIWVIGTIIETCSSYQFTFGIMQKYEMNKKDLKEFVKDAVLEDIFSLVMTVGLLELLAFCGEHMEAWTNGFTIGYVKSLAICVALGAVVFIFVSLAKLISYGILKKQYTFTPLEEGELRDKINSLQADSKKKVKHINVYNESKKTTTKNAFLLKLFWHREFGIADNFMNENAQEELLAVLSHEIGHLKHKKNILNYINYAVGIIAALGVVTLIAYPGICLWINAWIRESFNISSNNYYVLFIVFSDILGPLFYLFQLFGSYRSKWEEYEADREAVKNGYGEALIKTFKSLSSDELVNVYPHPFIEFAEYSHPGMYQRIKAIHEAEIQGNT